jgi:signal transduction histidine kinase
LAAEFLDNVPGECVRRLQQMALAGGNVDTVASPDPLLSVSELERLTSMQHRVSRNYFRLLEADRDLQTRVRGTRKSPGATLANAMDAERRRLGRELHTGLGQSLAGIHVHLSIIEDALPHPPEAVRKSLDRILTLADTALEQVRGVSRGLYVPAWQTQSLGDALRNLWEVSGISGKFAGSLDIEELPAEPPLDVRRALYLVAQEGISNAIQHADARRVRLSLRAESGRITLEVEDDGSGFRQPAATEQPAASVGIGLRSLRDLARELGGDLHTSNGPKGAKLTVSLPVIL